MLQMYKKNDAMQQMCCFMQQKYLLAILFRLSFAAETESRDSKQTL